MTAPELVRYLRAIGPQDWNVILHILADRLDESRLANGGRLIDQIDFKKWLEELADAGRHA